MIWQFALPHTSSFNVGGAPRVVQCEFPRSPSGFFATVCQVSDCLVALGADITMSPAAADQSPAARASRIQFWSERKAGNGNAERDVGQATRSQPLAELSEMGKRIAGVDPWEGEEREGFHGLTDEWTAGAVARL